MFLSCIFGCWTESIGNSFGFVMWRQWQELAVRHGAFRGSQHCAFWGPGAEGLCLQGIPLPPARSCSQLQTGMSVRRQRTWDWSTLWTRVWLVPSRLSSRCRRSAGLTGLLHRTQWHLHCGGPQTLPVCCRPLPLPFGPLLSARKKSCSTWERPNVTGCSSRAAPVPGCLLIWLFDISVRAEVNS